MKNIPNILTAFRIVLIGLLCYLFANGEYLFSFLTYLFAFGTDILDGYLARRNNWITNVGKVLDPLADKLMLVAVLCCFASIKAIPLYTLILIALIEITMICVGAVLYIKHIVVYADWFGKIATGLFVFAITMTFVHLIFDVFPWYNYLYLASIAASIVSFVHYGIRNFIRHDYE